MVGSIQGYELVGELGRGGMGRVYRARHRATGAIRALKVIDASIDPEALARFQRESQALARAAGPGVVAVHECGVVPGGLFFVMDEMRGGTLRDRLRDRGRLPWREAVSIAAGLARALERCHAQGIVHRDLKPENILFDDQGEARIADFGCVRDAAAPRLTQTGTVIGTPAYMAPEQILGLPVDARADVFSLALVLHEMLTGARPRAGLGIYEIGLSASTQSFPRPSAFVPVPRAVDLLLARALAPGIDDRFPGAGAFAAALEAAASSDPAKDPSGLATVSVSFNTTVVVSLLGAALAIAFLAFVVSRRERSGPEASPAPAAAATPKPAPTPTPSALRDDEVVEHYLAGDAPITTEQVLGAIDRIADAPLEPLALRKLARSATALPLEPALALREKHPRSRAVAVVVACARLGSGNTAERETATKELEAVHSLEGGPKQLLTAIRETDTAVKLLEVPLTVAYAEDASLRDQLKTHGALLHDAFETARPSPLAVEVILAPLTRVLRELALLRPRAVAEIREDRTERVATHARDVLDAIASREPDRLAVIHMLIQEPEPLHAAANCTLVQARRVAAQGRAIEGQDSTLGALAAIWFAGFEAVATWDFRSSPEWRERTARALDRVEKRLAVEPTRDVPTRRVIEHAVLCLRAVVAMPGPGDPPSEARTKAAETAVALSRQAFALAHAEKLWHALDGDARAIVNLVLAYQDGKVEDEVRERVRHEWQHAEILRREGKTAEAIKEATRLREPQARAGHSEWVPSPESIRALAVRVLAHLDLGEVELAEQDLATVKLQATFSPLHASYWFDIPYLSVPSLEERLAQEKLKHR